MTDTRVLVVDDDEGDRKLVRRLLRHLLKDVAVVEVDSFDAARAIGDDDFSFVFLDNRLPGGSGLDLIADLRSRWPRAAIFLMTGQGDEDLAKSAILKGATDYIAKGLLTEASIARMMKAGTEVIRMRAQIEDQHEELSVFSQVLIHDLKAPLRAIRFLSDQIAEDLGAAQPDGVADGVEMLQEQVQRMTELIDSLSGHIGLGRGAAPETVAVRDLIRRANNALAREIAESGAEITFDVGDLTVTGLAPQIAQLLQNLIANAIKYSGSAPPVITIGAEQRATGVQIEVCDLGIGIPFEHREAIFEPFARIHSGGAVPGSGLGLSTCRKIVRRHNGRIWCDGDRTIGTKIVFTLNDCALVGPSPERFIAA